MEGEQDNSRNNEDPSGALTRGNFGEDLQVQRVEQHEIPSSKFEPSKSPDGGKSVSSGSKPRVFLAVL
jgi:hypothetical protein